MEKRWKHLFIGLLIALAVAVLAFALFADIWLNQGSIRILGDIAKVNVHSDCYFIDTTTMEVTGSSTFRMDGFLFENFHGYMQLSQYPMSPDLVGRWDHGTVLDRNRLVFSTHAGLPEEDWQWEYYYDVQIVKGDPNLIVIRVHQREGSPLTAVCADTEEEAISNYQAYLEKLYN